MNSNQRTGLTDLVAGVAFAALAATTLGSTWANGELEFILVAAGLITPGLCLAGIGAAKYLGKIDADSETTSKRTSMLLTGITVIAFTTTAYLAIT